MESMIYMLGIVLSSPSCDATSVPAVPPAIYLRRGTQMDHDTRRLCESLNSGP